MKLIDILALFTLIVMVQGTFWASAVQPVILSLGAVLTAIDLDVLDGLPFITKQDKSSPDTEDGKEKIEKIDPPKVHIDDLDEGEDPKQDIAYEK